MEIIEYEEQKEKKTDEKRADPGWPVRHHPMDQHTHCGNPRRDHEKGIENIWRNKRWIFSKLDEIHEYEHPRSSMNSKLNKHKDEHTEIHYNQTFEIQKQRILREAREMTCKVM